MTGLELVLGDRAPSGYTDSHALLDSLEVATEPIGRYSILDAILDEPVAADKPVSLPEPVTATLEERYVEVQLLDWHMVLIPCVGCGCYPCKPQHLNVHTEIWVPTPGDVVKVRI